MDSGEAPRIVKYSDDQIPVQCGHFMLEQGMERPCDSPGIAHPSVCLEVMKYPH